MTKVNIELILLALLACVSSQGLAIPIFGQNLQELSVFSKKYTTTGADSSVNGSVMTGAVGTTGAGGSISGDFTAVGAITIGGVSATTGKVASVGGNMTSGGVLTTGDSSTVGGDITAGGAATVGANGAVGGNMAAAGVVTTGAASQVAGDIEAGGAATVGAGASVDGTVYSVGAFTDTNTTPLIPVSIPTNPVDAAALVAGLINTVEGNKDQILAAQLAFSEMDATEDDLDATMIADTVLFSGVYQAPSLSTTADITLTLDGQDSIDSYWVFNIGAVLAIGAGSKIVMVNGANSDSVIWNAGGSASIGEDASFLGTLLATGLISVGANAEALGSGGSCGGLFSALSYVSTGLGAQIGGEGCEGIASGFHVDTQGVAYFQTSAIQEPATWILFVTSLALLGLSMRRKKVCRVAA
jgi:cytoskeletal protein CcmA (bactofilin family)